MSLTIQISAQSVSLRAELNDTPTARAIYDALPLEASGNRLGEEIYFEIPIDEPLAPDATEAVKVGELGYWPPGKAFCVFFGRTPASSADEPRAASPVNRIGMVLDDATRLTDIPHGTTVRIEKA